MRNGIVPYVVKYIKLKINLFLMNYLFSQSNSERITMHAEREYHSPQLINKELSIKLKYKENG